MTTIAGTPGLDGSQAHGSLRERKKLATRRLIRRVALELAAERGYSHVTVEDIAEAADVSPRTFFNYFPSKEAVLLGADPARGAMVRERIITCAPGAPALEALRTVMVGEAKFVAGELRELGGDPVSWHARLRAARRDPQLRAAHGSQMAMIERSMAEALAERLHTDVERDPYPGLLAATATGVFRSSMAFWAASGGAVPLEQIIDLAFAALADGLPQDPALRHATGNHAAGNAADVTGATGRKDDDQ